VTLFLGDNMYPEGMTPERRDQADQRLRPQVRAATGSGAAAIFVPGNHDWADGGEEGLGAVIAQADYVTGLAGSDTTFLPAGGCPGPVVVDRYPGVRVIVVDTQWWLHDQTKPAAECPFPDTAAVITAFAGLLETDRHVVVAAHHPLFGYGRHAGFSDWRDHLKPPLIGSVIALARKVAPRAQDFNATAYRRMADAFEQAFTARARPGTLRVWTAGHEHSLQILDGDDPDALDFVLISGSAAKTNPLDHGSNTVFAHSNPGFIVLDVFNDRSVLARVVGDDGEEAFRYWLFDGRN
jgi:hypothetical protein